MTSQLVTATKTHALMMANNVRAAEVREIGDSHGMTVIRALIRELENSVAAWSWIVDGEVVCMFGVLAPALLGDSYPWFVSTAGVETHARQFARACKTLLPELLAHHPRMVGRVDARYELSVRWLRWLGAEIGEAEPWGVAQMPFHPFVIGG